MFVGYKYANSVWGKLMPYIGKTPICQVCTLCNAHMYRTVVYQILPFDTVLLEGKERVKVTEKTLHVHAWGSFFLILSM